MLISQPGSDYQIASISLDAGYTRDLILMLTDVHAVLDHLHLDGTQPQITGPAEEYLRASASPYTLPALIDALGAATTSSAAPNGKHSAASARTRTRRRHPAASFRPAAIPPTGQGQIKGELQPGATAEPDKGEQWRQFGR